MSNSLRPHELQHARPPVHHQYPEFTQTHVHRVSEAIQLSHYLSSPSPPDFNVSQHQGLFQWVSSSHQVAKLLEFQLQHQSFQWTPRTDLLQNGLVGPPCSPRDSQESSPTPQFKEESEKVGLKLSSQKTKIMASGPITSWQINGETMETVRDFIWGASKITADGDCSHEIKRCLLPRKAVTNLDSIWKSRDITLPTKVRLVKAMVFPVVMYGCESWTIKKAERWRIYAFELWCWRRLLRVP